LNIIKIPAAEFHHEKPGIAGQKDVQDGADGNVSPTHRHVGIASAEGELMGLLFFPVMDDGAPEIVMNMGMGDKIPQGLNRCLKIIAVKKQKNKLQLRRWSIFNQYVFSNVTNSQVIENLCKK
jgi:hypothetical protein